MCTCFMHACLEEENPHHREDSIYTFASTKLWWTHIFPTRSCSVRKNLFRSVFDASFSESSVSLVPVWCPRFHFKFPQQGFMLLLHLKRSEASTSLNHGKQGISDCLQGQLQTPSQPWARKGKQRSILSTVAAVTLSQIWDEHSIV